MTGVVYLFTKVLNPRRQSELRSLFSLHCPCVTQTRRVRAANELFASGLALGARRYRERLLTANPSVPKFTQPEWRAKIAGT